MTKPKARGTALVTGGSHGIGRAVSIGLAREGFSVIVAARSETELAQTVARIKNDGGEASAISCDLSRAASLNDLCKKVSAIADLTLIAHFAAPTPDPEAESSIFATDDEKIALYFDVIVKAPIVLTKLLAPALASGGRDSHIILFCSDWALRGSHGPAVFGCAKAALAHFGRSVRRELAKQKTRVSVILPGDVASYDKDWTKAKWDIDDSLGDVHRELGNTRIPLKDIVDTVLFCVNAKSARIEEIILVPVDPDYDY